VTPRRQEWKSDALDPRTGGGTRRQRMIPKSGNRFSDKIMRNKILES
jgi:hypothetical protein